MFHLNNNSAGGRRAGQNKSKLFINFRVADHNNSKFLTLSWALDNFRVRLCLIVDVYQFYSFRIWNIRNFCWCKDSRRRSDFHENFEKSKILIFLSKFCFRWWSFCACRYFEILRFKKVWFRFRTLRILDEIFVRVFIFSLAADFCSSFREMLRLLHFIWRNIGSPALT